MPHDTRMSSVAERLKQSELQVAPQAWLRVRSLPHLIRRGHFFRRRTVRQYLSTISVPRLQVGAGPVALPGWLNSDLLAGDI